jgi:predicted amidohydrolase
MKPELTLALCQMTSIDQVTANYQQIENLIAKVPETTSVDIFCFPENCLYMRIVEGEKIEGLKLSDPVFKDLSALAKKRKSYLHLGASPLQMEGVVFNATILISPDGQIHSPYQKVHLFDIQLQGQKAVRESDAFQHGSKPEIVEIFGWKMGQSICYDLRFAELYSHYAQQGCDLILVPSSFLPKTGEAHWEILLRARAIESQAYVAASAQGGHHLGSRGGGRDTYGHSLLVDPWGSVMTEIKTQPAVEVCVLTKDRIEQVRRQIPMRSHRRLSPQS